ncbi:hypothetical protein LSCM4_00404 [Leishmania orientalis]|uniref:Uncharacterized protein n=1 Tax=Leishmania orientalis TaxID=2249476 RepID=A0A836FZS9_9TRYP|nr:hypothetical protein LSCM4_00404 [Leishmania orientalis]
MSRGVASHAAKRGALPVLCSRCLCAAAASGRARMTAVRGIQTVTECRCNSTLARLRRTHSIHAVGSFTVV